MSGYQEQYRFKRFLEILPGAVSWTVLLSPIVLSLTRPSWVAIFMIAFDFYWLIKSVYMGVYLVSSYLHMREENRINWLSRLKELEDLDHHIKVVKESCQTVKSFVAKSRFKRELEQLLILRENRQLLKDWRKIFHIVLLPTYQEPKEVLDNSIKAIENSFYPNKKIIVVVATEERAGKQAQAIAESLKEKYQDKFFKFLVTKHPQGIVGELKAKGANVTWAAKKVKKFVDQKKIDYSNVIVSTFDCDTRPSPQYFGALTYRYVTNPNRLHRSFQPIPIYANNLWQVPLINRLVAFGSTFWQMIESVRPWRMINFSSQAMSLKTLIEIDYWDTGIVSEDSKQYYRAFFTYQGDHECVPIFTPVYMDAMQGNDLWQALVNQYKQKRRWAWGLNIFLI